MHPRRIIVYAALGAALLGHFVARPIHRRARFVEAMRRSAENGCCTVGSASLCAPALNEMARLAKGSDAVGTAARSQLRACTTSRERAAAYRAETGAGP